MKKLLLFIIFFIGLMAMNAFATNAQGIGAMNDSALATPTPDEFYKAEVIEVYEHGSLDEETNQQFFQKLKVRLLNGSEKGKEIETTTTYFPTQAPGQELELGDTVIVVKMFDFNNEPIYQITDHYRLPQLYWLVGGFILLAIWLGRRRGVSSLFGLIFSILILTFYIVPQILNGANLFSTILIGSTVIITVAIYLAHGFNRRTSISLFSTLITLCLSVLIAGFAVRFAELFGLGTEDAYFLISASKSINLQGLLFGGIIIGTLGVLDDITTAQTAVVAELRLANKNLSRMELYKRGLRVGREHIASLINTLVLAYAGASLPIFLLFTINKTMPLWTVINSEFIAEEIIRTLVGSSTLILSVPIATFLAAYCITRWPEKPGTHEADAIHYH